MTNYYYFINAGRVIDESTLFYKVSIGTTVQAQRDFLFLTAFSVDHNCYFEICSEKSTEFIARIAQSLNGTPAVIAGQLVKMRKISARDLVRSIKENHQVIPDGTISANLHSLAIQLDDNYRYFSAIAKR